MERPNDQRTHGAAILRALDDLDPLNLRQSAADGRGGAGDDGVEGLLAGLVLEHRSEHALAVERRTTPEAPVANAQCHGQSRQSRCRQEPPPASWRVDRRGHRCRRC
jgi:hypothetical protein